MHRTSIAATCTALLFAAASCRSTGAIASTERSAFDSGSAGGTAPANAAASQAAPVTAASAESRKLVVEKAVLGQPAPDFKLTDVDGKIYQLSQFRGRPVVLEWFNPRSEHSQDLYREGGILREMPERLAGQGVVWLTINSEAPGEPGSGADENKAFKLACGMWSPILMDPTGAVGRAYGAKTAPHLFLISGKGLLVYRGALDNAPLGVVPIKDVKTNYLDLALRDLRSGHAVMIGQTQPYGARIHYARP